MRLTDSNLRGRTVVAADGQVLGEVVGLFLEEGPLRVEALQVKLRKESADLVGAERGVFRAGVLEIPVHAVQSIGDAIVLAARIEDLRAGPAADAEVPASQP